MGHHPRRTSPTSRPTSADRLSQWTSDVDVFATYRIDEQLMKALDRKVWLPCGGSLVIDRTEAMIVVDVNTGKFTGQGGNLEETVTRNNLEAAEEIVRQLRLRDLGGIIVIDFIDMVLESNRDLVLRRLLECLGRDRTKHQVAEVTSLGLVQMTRKRVGQGLLESFSETCVHCNGRGVIVHMEQPTSRPAAAASASKRGRGGRRSTPTSTRRPLDVVERRAAEDGAETEAEVAAEVAEPVALAGSGLRARRGAVQQRRRGGGRGRPRGRTRRRGRADGRRLPARRRRGRRGASGERLDGRSARETVTGRVGLPRRSSTLHGAGRHGRGEAERPVRPGGRRSRTPRRSLTRTR